MFLVEESDEGGYEARAPGFSIYPEAETFEELMETTEWEKYGHRNNPKCADCTAHCGYEPTAVKEATASLKNMILSARAAV